MPRILGIDFGIKRIGLAISDERERIAFPYKTIQNIKEKDAIKEIGEIIVKENVGKIIAGEPLNLKGESSEITLKAREFFSKLQEQVSVPLIFFDERFSSKIARNNVSFKKFPKEIIDQEAARVILEDYLKSNSI